MDDAGLSYLVDHVVVSGVPKHTVLNVGERHSRAEFGRDRIKQRLNIDLGHSPSVR